MSEPASADHERSRDASASASSDLLQRALSGDQGAMQSLLQRHLPGLRAFVRLRMGARIRAREESTDLVQSVCREVLQHADRFQHGGETGFRQWLYRTALRKIGDHDDYHRAACREAGREVAPASDQDLGGAFATLSTPSRAAIAREELARLELAFDRLSDDQREVVLSARMLGLSHREIAERMGRSELAVRTLLCRAMARLADLMAEGDQDSAP